MCHLKYKNLSYGMTVSYEVVTEAAGYAVAQDLFREYAMDIGVDLSFQGFEEELGAIAAQYGPPSGGLVLSLVDDAAAGCVGVRRLQDGVAELKRMYVRPAYRGYGLGVGLLQEALRVARSLGYRTIRLDTLATMTGAQALYRRFGFYAIPAYRFNPLEGAVYMEMRLT